MTFDEWWKQTKPAECDELKPYFEEAWEISAATEREACADVAGFAERWIGDWIARYGNRSVSDAIRERPNDKAQPDAQGSLRGSAGAAGSTPATNGERT